jgi:uncharacterized protein YjiK
MTEARVSWVRRLIRWALPTAVVLALLYAISWYEETHLLFGANFGTLADYQLVGQPLRVGNGARQCSGLTFDSDHRHLFAVIGAPPMLIEMDLQGKELRRIKLDGFEDTEGVAYLGEGRFAVIEERRGVVDLFNLGERTDKVDKSKVRSIRILPEPDSIWILPEPDNNRGLEGVAYAPNRHLLFLAKERLPRRLLQLTYPPPDSGEVALTEPWDMEEQPWWGLRSLSDLYYDQSTDHLFVLTLRSKAIVEFSLDGKEVGRFSLKSGSAGLRRVAHSTEGITMSDDRTLYICGEKDELFLFRPPGASRD